VPQEIVCHIRYELDLEKLAQFEEYARAWIELIERYGGVHHGYLLPSGRGPAAPVSFPGIGREAPDNVAIASFSFPDEASYLAYRRDVSADPDCARAERLLRESGCVTAYERGFMRRL
jgi:hypothetical protein